MDRAQRLGAVLASLCLLGLAGCTDGEEPTPAPSPESSSPASSGSPSDSSPSETTTVVPASGKPMVARSVSLRAPKGWRVEKTGIPPLVVGRRARPTDDLLGTVELLQQHNYPASTPQEQVKAGLSAFSRAANPEISFDVELGGVAAYRAVGKYAGTLKEEYGAVRDGVAATVIFSFYPQSTKPAERQQIVESVLASFGWS